MTFRACCIELFIGSENFSKQLLVTSIHDAYDYVFIYLSVYLQ